MQASHDKDRLKCYAFSQTVKRLLERTISLTSVTPRRPFRSTDVVNEGRRQPSSDRFENV